MKTWNCEISVFIFFRYILRSGIAASHGCSILYFLRNLQIVFHSCAKLHPYRQCTRVPFFPHPQQHCLFFVFLTAAILRNIGYISLWLCSRARLPLKSPGLCFEPPSSLLVVLCHLQATPCLSACPNGPLPVRTPAIMD